ncbi:hypothetical protein QLX08_011338 [Tetragonisca angustula]|uniref:Uncharacterized protein n=1 Tax=Tetragonisca angustula TaxID=166442 RepID=A0AAW0Z8P0_9HYME
MFIGASVANSASYGTVRAPFDQCCGLTSYAQDILCNFTRFIDVIHPRVNRNSRSSSFPSRECRSTDILGRQ